MKAWKYCVIKSREKRSICTRRESGDPLHTETNEKYQTYKLEVWIFMLWIIFHMSGIQVTTLCSMSQLLSLLSEDSALPLTTNATAFAHSFTYLSPLSGMW